MAEVFGYSNEATILTIIMELMENGGTYSMRHCHVNSIHTQFGALFS